MLVGGASSLFALGHSRYSLLQNSARALWIFIGLPLGWHYFGIRGVVGVVASTEVPVFFVIWIGLKKYGILSITKEVRTIPFVLGGIATGFAVLHCLNWIAPALNNVAPKLSQ